VTVSAILGRYARSLAEVVFEQKLEQEVTEDLRTYGAVFGEVPGLVEALDSPGIPRRTKERLLENLLEIHPVHPVTHNFLRVLLDNGRIRHYRQIHEIFQDLVDEHLGVVRAQVRSAAPLDAADLEAIRDRLSAMTGKTVQLVAETDAGLLGGVVVQIGDTVYDGSIRTRLDKMGRRLAGA